MALGGQTKRSQILHLMGDSSYPSSATTSALLAFSPLAHLASELIFSGFGVPSLRESCTSNLSVFLLVLQGLPAVVLCVHVTAWVSRRTTASKARTATPAVASGVPSTGVLPSRPDGGEVERQHDDDANTVRTCNRAKAVEPELVQESARDRASVELPKKVSVRDTVKYYEFLQFLASPGMKSLPSTPAGKSSSRANRSYLEVETDASSETSSTIPVPRVVHTSSMDNVRKNLFGLKRQTASERRKIFSFDLRGKRPPQESGDVPPR